MHCCPAPEIALDFCIPGALQAVVEARKQRLKAEKEHACAADRAAIARQLNAGKKDKARLQRALDKARAELALAGIDRLPELHEVGCPIL